MYRWFHFTLQKKFSEVRLPKTKFLMEQLNDLTSDLHILFFECKYEYQGN